MLIRTIKLLTGNRIDVIFKILYLRLHHLGAKKIANRLYNDHIKLITNGVYKENGFTDLQVNLEVVVAFSRLKNVHSYICIVYKSSFFPPNLKCFF